MNKKKNIFLMVLIVILVTVCAGCSKWTTPPNAEKINKIFEQNKEDFIKLANYMTDLGCDSIIDSTDGKIYRCDTFTYEQINDKEIEKCISHLLSHRIVIQASKESNTIQFYMWGHIIQPIGCGAAYSIDGSGELSVQFLLNQEPLSEPGWYYYYSDFNKWRTEHSTAGDSLS